MNKFRSKINNSYESSDSSGSASSAELRRRSSDYDAMEKGLTMNSLMLPDYESYNISTDDVMIPNIDDFNPLPAPSYEPDYDYYNEYSTTPLVYSWLPIVPGFNSEGTDNLQNFQHIVKRCKPQPLDISNASHESIVISDQNVKYADSLTINGYTSAYDFQRLELLDSSKEVTSFSHQLEDSCNAMDLNISCHQKANDETSKFDLSFNGKISEMTSSNDKDNTIDECPAQFELLPEESNENVAPDTTNEDEEERIRNESFELLKKEDSSKMILVNEKSPDVEENESDGSSENEEQLQEDEISPIEHCKNDRSGNLSIEKSEMCEEVTHKSLKDTESFVRNNIHTSLSELCAPPSIATLPLSLSEMLAAYKQNLSKEPNSSIKSNALYIPSHPLNEVFSMGWPDLLEVKAHGLMYNRNDDCEEIEHMRLRFTDKFIRAETTSSYTHKNGPTSAKKRVERLRFLTQSPGSRLSHLANRRKVFSSAHLKSNSINASQKSFSCAFLIDKTKLYQKKKTSAKKKTPGKKKTPKSAKRQQQLQIAKPAATVASSKRALFTSPAKSSKLTTVPKETSTLRGVLPRRNLFSPTHNSKRRRSPSPDAENRFGKSRRLESPSKHPNQLLAKSRSFSVAATSTSSGSLDEHFKKTLYYRTQSEMTLNHSTESKNNLGFKRPLNEDEKKKLLWSASSVLQSKQINREHEKFREYMSMLCRLVKKLLNEFYHPGKSMSNQMQKFSTLTVFHVIQGRSFDEIYSMAKTRLEGQNHTKKISGYIGPDEYEKNRYIRKNSSLLLMPSLSCTSLNSSTMNSDSFTDGSFLDRSSSDTSLNRSTSKSNAENCVLRENFQIRENSARKAFGSDSNINKLPNTSTPSSNVLKAKRQISF